MVHYYIINFLTVQYSSSVQENPLYFEIDSATFTVEEDDKAPLAANMMVNVDSEDRKVVKARPHPSTPPPPPPNGNVYEEIKT